MQQCKIYDCEWDWHSTGVIIDSKVYVLDKENKPTAVSCLAWEAWDNMLPLMQFYIGIYFEAKFDKVGEWKSLFEIAPCFNPSRDEVLRQACSKREYVSWVKKDGKYGYIDDQGNYFVEPLYDDARNFWAYHYAPAKVYEKWGFIDRTGKFIIPPIFSDIGGDHYSFYVVNQEGTWGILTPELNIIMPEKGARYVVYNGEKVYLKNG